MFIARLHCLDRLNYMLLNPKISLLIRTAYLVNCIPDP